MTRLAAFCLALPREMAGPDEPKRAPSAHLPLRAPSACPPLEGDAAALQAQRELPEGEQEKRNEDKRERHTQQVRWRGEGRGAKRVWRQKERGRGSCGGGGFPLGGAPTLPGCPPPLFSLLSLLTRTECVSFEQGPLHTRAKSRDHEIVRVQRPSQDPSKLM